MLALLFARRYLFSAKSHSVINVISAVSVVAVGVPIAAMIILMSVFNGFAGLVEGMQSAFDADLEVRPREGKTFVINELPVDSLRSIAGVRGVSFALEQSALAEYSGRQVVVTVRGVDDDYVDVLPMDEYIHTGEFALRLGEIEQAILAHGHVRSAEAYLTPDGRIKVEVAQHAPVMRMMLAGGYDFYLTERGEVFRSPELSAVYVPVVTGRFDVPFSAKHEGATDSQLKLKINELDSLIDATKEARNDLLIEHRHIQRQRSKLRGRTLKKGMFEAKEEYDNRKKAHDQMKKDSNALYTYRMRVRQKAADQKLIEIDRLVEKQKKLQKNYEDFINLTNFVKLIEGDDFWQAQIVEIVVSQSQNGALFLRLVPRAGNHTIIFGRIEKVERKLDRLMRFYREGLDKEGWNTYRTVDVRFDDQVVCTRR